MSRRTIISESSLFRITLLRHPQSEGNVARIPQGHNDSPLTASGQAQAEALADRWAAEERAFNRILTSPLQRARSTAELIAERLKIPVETDAVWLERDVGQMSTLDQSAVNAHYAAPESISPYHDAFGLGSEGQWQLYLRAGQALHGLLNRSPGAYLVVSHGGLLNAVLYAILGLAPQAFGHGPRFHFDNCSISELSYSPDEHRWTLIRFNDTQHLKGMEPADG